MSVMSPDLAIMSYFVDGNGALEIHLYDDSDIDGTGPGLYCKFGSSPQESLEKLKEMYNFILECQKL